jgi:hypothetical protein
LLGIRGFGTPSTLKPQHHVALGAVGDEMRLSEKAVELIMFLTLVVCLALVIVCAR